MQIKSFRDLYLAELQELRSVETQLAQALPRMAEAASHAELKRALQQHAAETTRQKERVDALLQKHGAAQQTHTDQAMEALIRETEKMIAIVSGGDLRDAGLVASAQRAEHYEIAAYGSAAAIAGQMDLRDDQKELHAILEEEKKADALLTDLAKRSVNPAAVAAA